MLLQLRDYIRKEGVVSTQQLTRAFQVDDTALLPMLDVLVKKSVIHPCQDKTPCQSSCFKCKTGKPAYYQYIQERE